MSEEPKISETPAAAGTRPAEADFLQNPGAAELDSRVASELRFPLIALIAIIHVTVAAPAEFPATQSAIALFQNVLTRVAVPLFFFISGYFYFFKTENFGARTWLAKTRSRVATLLVPYVVWNAISALQFFLRWKFFPETAAGATGADFLQWLAVVRGGVPENAVLTDVPALGFLFAALAGTPLDGDVLPRPLVGQFWFVRDLFFVGIFSFAWFPILKNRVGAPLLLCAAGALWFALGNDLHVNAQCATPGIFFFCLGAFFAIRKIGFAALAHKIRVPAAVVYAVLAFADWRWDAFGFSDVPALAALHAPIHDSAILVGAAALVGWCAAGTRAGVLRGNAFLAASTFFVFGMHAPASRLFEAIFLPLFPQNSSLAILAAFAAFALFALAFSLALFALISRFVPALLVPLAGGRGRKTAGGNA